jgi:hypothetical protein
MKYFFIVFLLLTNLILSGCSTKLQFEAFVDSIGESSTANQTYVLLSDNTNIDMNSLEFKEYSEYVKYALNKKGFIESNFEHAEIVIFLDYGISEPQENTYTYSSPIIGQTGTSSSSTYGTINTYGNALNYTSRTYNNPTYGIVGSQTHSGSYTTYKRYIIISAINLAEYKIANKKNPIWKTSVVSTGSVGDLRRVL